MNNKIFAHMSATPYVAAQEIAHRLDEQGKNGSRSSKRTQALNEGIVDLLRAMTTDKPGWEFDTEVNIPCSRGDNFKVDVVAYHKGTLRAVILLKAVVRSYNKNRHNYANTLEGEMARIFDVPGRERLQAITIDWVPNEVPAPTSAYPLRRETTNIPNTDLAEERWNNALASRQSGVSFCKLQFSYDFHRHPAITEMTGHEKLDGALRRLFK